MNTSISYCSVIDRASVLCWLIFSRESLFLHMVFSCASLWKKLFSGCVPGTENGGNVYVFTSSPGSGLGFMWIPVFMILCHADSINAVTRPTHRTGLSLFFMANCLSPLNPWTTSFLITSPGQRAKVFSPHYSICPGPRQHRGLLALAVIGSQSC